LLLRVYAFRGSGLLPNDVVRAFATARVLANSKPPLARVILLASRSKYTDRFRAKLPAEITKLEGEMKQIAEASRQKIEGLKK
jgi:hypothetical protein